MTIDPKSVEYLVEGDSFISWREFHTGVVWEQIAEGFWQNIGEGSGVDGKKLPICVSINYARIDGHVVAFYEAMSRLVDWDAVEDWVKKTFPYAKGKVDLMNFGHCLSDLKIDVRGVRCTPCDRYRYEPAS